MMMIYVMVAVVVVDEAFAIHLQLLHFWFIPIFVFVDFFFFVVIVNIANVTDVFEFVTQHD